MVTIYILHSNDMGDYWSRGVLETYHNMPIECQRVCSGTIQICTDHIFSCLLNFTLIVLVGKGSAMTLNHVSSSRLNVKVTHVSDFFEIWNLDHDLFSLANFAKNFWKDRLHIYVHCINIFFLVPIIPPYLSHPALYYTDRVYFKIPFTLMFLNEAGPIENVTVPMMSSLI